MWTQLNSHYEFRCHHRLVAANLYLYMCAARWVSDMQLSAAVPSFFPSSSLAELKFIIIKNKKRKRVLSVFQKATPEPQTLADLLIIVGGHAGSHWLQSDACIVERNGVDAGWSRWLSSWLWVVTVSVRVLRHGSPSLRRPTSWVIVC